MNHQPVEHQPQPPTILLIDHDQALRYGRTGVLLEAGYRLMGAATVDEAWLMLISLNPHLVVLGATRSATVGWEFCRKVKGHPETAHVPIVCVSDRADERITGLEAGADVCLAEPLAPGELAATVRALLRLSRGSGETRALAARVSRLERQFAEATDAAHCGVWDWDIRSGRLEWFGHLERLAGLSPGSFSGRIEGFSEILHPEDRARVWRKFEDLMARREVQFEDEHRYVHPDGSVHWMLGRGRLFYDDHGHAVRMTGVVQDITARKLAEQRQQLESERSRLLACAAEQLLVADDPAKLMAGVFETVRRHLEVDGYLHYRADASGSILVLEACTGVPDDRLPELRQLELDRIGCGTLPQQGVPVIYARLQESPDEGAQPAKALGFQAYACHSLLVGDRLMGTLAFATRTRDRFEPDELAFMETLCHYVAATLERLRLEVEAKERAQRLRHSEEHLRAAMDLNPQIPWVARPDGLVEDFNERWLRLTGFSREEALGDGWMRVVHEEDLADMVAAWTRSLQTGKPYDIEHRVKTVSGGDRWMRSRAFPYRDRAGTIIRWYGTTEDIHDRRQAETALRDSEERFRTMAQAVPSFLFEADAAGRNIWTSDGWCRCTGQTPEQVAGHGWAEALHPDDRAASLDQWTRCMRDGVPFESRQRLRRVDGTYAWVVAKALPVRDPQRGVIRWLGSVTDVDRLVRGEAALRESDERFRQIADATDSVFWMMQLDPEALLYVSPAFQQVWGRPALALHESPRIWSQGIHPADRARVEEAFTRWLADPERTVFDVEYRIVHPDGAIRWIADRGHAVRDASGRVYRLSGIARDVTTLKETERSLRESEARFRNMADHAPVMIWVTDQTGSCTFLSQSWYDCTGYTPQDGLGFGWLDAVHPEDRADAERSFLKAHAEHSVYQAEYRLRRHDGHYVWVLETATPRQSNDGHFLGFIGSVTDITECKRQEEELRRWKDELEQRVENRTRELMASEERLRVLASQLSMAEQRERRKLAKDLHDYLAQFLVVGKMKIAKMQPALSPAAQAMADDVGVLFQQALTYTRTMIAELSPPSLGLRDGLEWLAERMQSNGLRVTVMADRAPASFPEDRALSVIQSVRELLFNVLKHAGIDRASVSLAIEENGDLCVAVTDRGKGLSPDAMERAAQPGHLGLFSVRERMEAMGGRVEFRSAPGEGTTVTLILPGARRE